MKVKDNKGSITIFVLVGLLFMSAFLLISYGYNVNKSKIAKEQFNLISKIYSPNKSDEESYTDAYTTLRNKNKQTLTSSSEDSNVLELTKTFESNMGNLIIHGNSIQDTEPTPTNPVEIQSLGNKTINIWDEEWEVGSLTNEGENLTSSNSIRSKNYIPIKAEETYYFKVPQMIRVVIFDENKNYSSHFYPSDGNTKKIGINGYIKFAIGDAGNTPAVTTYNNDICISVSNESTNGTYEPYGKYKIPIKVSAKNVVNREDDTKTGAGKTVPFERSYPNTGAGTYTFSCEVEVKNYEGDNFMLSYGYKDYDGIITYGTFLKFDSYSQHSSEEGYRYSFSFTVEEKLTFFYVYIHTGCTGGEVTLKNQMLTLNNTDITYEPYYEQKVTNIYLNEPLRKVGEYSDYIDFKNKKVIRHINNEFITQVSGKSRLSGTYTTFLSTISMKPYIQIENNLINYTYGYADSNKFLQNKRVYYDLLSYGGYIQSYITSSGDYRVAYSFNDTTITTVEQAQEKIGDGFEVNYVLETPIEEAISLPELKTYEDYTKIEVLTDIAPSKIEATYEGYTLE